MTNRRTFIKKSGIALSSLPFINLIALSGSVSAADAPKVELDDPTAVSLKYVHDATKSETRTDTNAICANCQLYPDSEANEWGPCTIFPGKLVNANGWCSAWVAKQ